LTAAAAAAAPAALLLLPLLLHHCCAAADGGQRPCFMLRLTPCPARIALPCCRQQIHNAVIYQRMLQK